MGTRDHSYAKFWRELIEMYGTRCFYCRTEIATTIDHIIPYSYDQDNAIENLVPACSLCNLIASDKHFETVEQKRQYILHERKHHFNNRAICTECLLPFAYRIHSPSMFLCAECYDCENGTNEANKPEWKRWIHQLWRASIPAEAHRIFKKRAAKIKKSDRDARIEVLIDEYIKIIDADDEFARMLVY